MPQRNRELSTDLAKGSGLTPNLYLSAVLKTPLTSGFNSKFGDSQGFPCGSAGKESACNVGDLDSILGLGRSPGEGKGYPFQYSGLENSMDYGPWGYKRVGHDLTTRLNNNTCEGHKMNTT